MDITSGVVLAAGEGERLRPLTRNRPKPMLSAGTRPILAHVLDALVNAGIDDIHIVVGYNRDRVQNHFGSTYRNRQITYHVEEKQLGTGHAVLQVRDEIDEDFVVINGDELVRNEVIADVIEAHSMDTVATMSVLESEQAAEFGAVRLNGDRVTELVEKPKTGGYRLLNRGVYAFGPSIFRTIRSIDSDGELRLTDAIAAQIDAGNEVRGVQTDSLWEAATYPWDLLAVNAQVLTQGWVPQPEQDSGVYVHEAASVHEDAVLTPPVVIDADAVVDAGAVVGPHTAVGRNSTIETGAVVTRSLVESDVQVGANATVAESILAQGAHAGAGVTLGGGLSQVQVGDKIHSERALGTVLADRAELKSGVTVTPGTLIGPRATIADGSTVRSNVEANSEVRS
jgi:glucose-1-phosphate thymidylyltransferase